MESRRHAEAADAAGDEWVNLNAEVEKLKEQLRVLEQRRADEQASFQRTYDKMLGVEQDLRAALAERPKEADGHVATALRQLATHVVTFVELYDPKMLEGDYDSARRLRDIRDRARVALEHVPPVEAQVQRRGPVPSPAQAAVLAKIGKK